MFRRTVVDEDLVSFTLLCDWCGIEGITVQRVPSLMRAGDWTRIGCEAQEVAIVSYGWIASYERKSSRQMVCPDCQPDPEPVDESGSEPTDEPEVLTESGDVPL